jgi:hypothetical protein
MSGALIRFWWMVALGVVVGLFVSLWMVYELPGFTPREQPVYTANARLFVTSSEGQYVRISVPRTVETDSADGTGRGGGGGPLVVNDSPNVQPLLAAANMFPLLIESDEVAQLRERMFGPIPGDVVANAYSAVSTPQRYSPAQIPVIDIFATSPTTKQAISLAETTADAFKRWIRLEQDRAGVAPEARILIKQLRAPTVAYPSGGPSYGIPILAALAIMAAFGMIAVVIDQLFPRDSTSRQLQSETS